MPPRVRPSFKHPPVIEVVCGVQFQSLTELQAPHLGLFWNHIRSRFPVCQSKPPVVSTAGPNAEITVGVSDVPPLPRIWFINPDATELVQVQADRFFFNWKKADSDVPYPRYPTVVARFEKMLRTFQQFVAQHKLGALTPVAYELTYVNHVPPEHGWKTFGGIGKVFPDLQWRTDSRYLPEPEAFAFRAQFGMNERSKLHLTVQSAARSGDLSKKIIRFDWAARGMPEKPGPAAMRSWFDSANEWIVDAFIDITDQDVQRTIWMRKK